MKAWWRGNFHKKIILLWRLSLSKRIYLCHSCYESDYPSGAVAGI